VFCMLLGITNGSRKGYIVLPNLITWTWHHQDPITVHNRKVSY
jgi:hypothetical protein